MHKLRNIATGGVLKEYLKQLGNGPEDLIGRDENKTEKEINEDHIYFSWQYQEKLYKHKK